MTEIPVPPVEEAKKKVKRRRRPQTLRRYEVRLGAKRVQADDAEVYQNGLLHYIVDSTHTYMPITKKIEIVDRTPAVAQPRSDPGRPIYDPQLPHTAKGNLTVEELAERERLRQIQVEQFRRDRNAELEDATHAGGLLPFTPSMA